MLKPRDIYKSALGPARNMEDTIVSKMEREFSISAKELGSMSNEQIGERLRMNLNRAVKGEEDDLYDTVASAFSDIPLPPPNTPYAFISSKDLGKLDKDQIYWALNLPRKPPPYVAKEVLSKKELIAQIKGNLSGPSTGVQRAPKRNIPSQQSLSGNTQRTNISALQENSQAEAIRRRYQMQQAHKRAQVETSLNRVRPGKRHRQKAGKIVK